MTMMENIQVHIKAYIKTFRLTKKKDILVMLCIARNEEFQFVYLTKTVLKTTSNVIFYRKKVDLHGS